MQGDKALTKDTKCKGPCSGGTTLEILNKTMNPDCPQCMEIWCKFIEKQNIYVATDKRSDW